MSTALLLSLSLLAADPVPAKPLAITGVTLIDGTGAPARAGMTVVVAGDRISAVGKAGEVKVPAEARVIDGAGKYLIPGLWDMHVHWYNKEYLPLFTANGVTGVRIMFGSPMHLEWKKDHAAGKLPRPRLVVASPIVDGPKPVWPGSIAVTTPEDGRKAVKKSQDDGYDFVKVYSLLPRDAYFAIAAEAKARNISFAGHVPPTVSAAEASDAGQRTMEHLYGIALACSARETELAKDMVAASKGGRPDPALMRRVGTQVAESYDAQKAAALFAKFKANGTWQVPTLTVLRAIAHLDDAAFTNDERLKYMPPFVRSFWDPKNDARLKNFTKEDFAHQKVAYKRSLKLVGDLHRAGVEILAGTDTLNPYCFPGFSLPDELALLVEAGLSPAAALRTATRNPARYLGRDKDLGTVEAGKLADLVLLDADPLADITHTKKIAAVVGNGKLYSKDDLQKMKDDAAAMAGKK